MKLTGQELNERIKWNIGDKLLHCVSKFVEFYEFSKGNVYLSFSGGKDSQVLLDIINKTFNNDWEENEIIDKRILNELKIQSSLLKTLAKIFNKPLYVESVFANTGLEFPEIVDHVKTFENVVIVKPRMGFTRVIKEIGVAVGSKKIARMLRDLQNPTEKNRASRKLYLTGVKRDGTKSNYFRLPKLFKKFINSDFKVSDKCCDIFKKEPFKIYEKKTKNLPIQATTIGESLQRRASYLQTQCNSFGKGKEKCRPYSIFTEKDTWLYHDVFKLKFSDVYYDREVEVKELNGDVFVRKLEAETRTGCTFCMFGLHLEPKNKLNRIQRLRLSHPQYYDIVINKCGLGDVLKFLEIPYEVND